MNIIQASKWVSKLHMMKMADVLSPCEVMEVINTRAKSLMVLEASPDVIEYLQKQREGWKEIRKRELTETGRKALL